MLEYRRDIDGMRAIAVISVVLYHAVPAWMPSGFTGVDVFFVISGYLIGGIIYSGVSEKTFTFLDFYARRARRLLPALCVVVLATLAIGYFFFETHRYQSLSAQAITALVGLSNFYFEQRTDYFSVAGELQPLMMTWSLGVEEQFYLLFPFLMFVLMRLPVASRIPIMVGIAIVSFGLSLYILPRAPHSAFFLLPPRAWELAAGVILAMAHRQGAPDRLSRSTADLLAVTGLGFIVGACFLLDDLPFPGTSALLPVLGTVMLLQARGSFINRVLLSARPMVFIGLISYSWYLWHWPLLSFVRVAADETAPTGALLAVAGLSLVLAFLTWLAVERPFRRRRTSRGTTVLRYAGVMAAVSLLPASVILANGMPSRLPENIKLAEAIGSEGRGVCLVDFRDVTANMSEACMPANSRYALLGDSHGSAIAISLAEYAARSGDTLKQYVKSACPPVYGYAHLHKPSPRSVAACGEFIMYAVEEIAADPDVEVVFVAGYWPKTGDTYFTWQDGEVGPEVDSLEVLEASLSALSERLAEAGKEVVLIGDVPRLKFDAMQRHISDGLPVRRNVRDLLSLGGPGISNGVVAVAALDSDYDPGRQIVAQVGRKYPHTRVVDIRNQLCAQDTCLYSHDGMPLFFDDHHLSVAGARYIDWDRSED